MEPPFFTPSIGILRDPRNVKSRAANDEDFDEEAAALESLASSSPNDESENDANVPPDYPARPLQRSFALPASGLVDATGFYRRPQRNLKHQHLAAVDAILQKSLLNGDYDRASIAFGILLRLKINQSRLDLRKRGLWGVGAEILLFRGSASTSDSSARQLNGATPAFGEDNFKIAKAYFERLILQYPHRKHRPHDVNELRFSVAMFGFWIYQIQSRRDMDEESTMDSSDQSEMGDANDSQVSEQKAKLSMRHLEEVREVADQIASLTRLPPFDRHIPMLQLQSDVLEWVAHLSQGVHEDSNVVDGLRRQSIDIRSKVSAMSQS